MPDNQDPPASRAERFLVSDVSFYVTTEFVFPEFDVRFGRRCQTTAFVTVPIATVDKDDLIALRKHDVRGAWQIFSVQTKSEAHIVGNTSYNQLGRRVGTAYRAHYTTARRLIDGVHRSTKRLLSPEDSKEASFGLAATSCQSAKLGAEHDKSPQWLTQCNH